MNKLFCKVSYIWQESIIDFIDILPFVQFWFDNKFRSLKYVNNDFKNESQQWIPDDTAMIHW